MELQLLYIYANHSRTNTLKPFFYLIILKKIVKNESFEQMEPTIDMFKAFLN